MFEHPKKILTISNSKIFQDQKIVVRGKPIIKTIGIL